ncbi:SMP-30/gluconolactonase/LRE family protein [Prauserella muralis]|uniref:Strictosidine synthase n=1 Tax=Prauserella muralis TaxID=588067 RepID=A0A2V4ARM3_9PSEU|nr:SMP-30/gluconolactonase/LRE family protein [Prauserella muralis]PXY22674.1 strictosidine synthase [Prauserella muralis]TWE28386.1 SMP-30/gluconolaconase/LRE-like protein [Prauserella muralis]
MRFRNPRLLPVGAHGTEDVLVDTEGRLYTGVADGRILRVDPGGGPVETVAEVPGRPLGLEFLGEDELLVCASDAGLLTVRIADGTVRTLLRGVPGAPLLACNNAAVADDGTVYFSDSSRYYVIPRWRVDIIEHTRSGRLLRRNPDGTVDQLLTGLDFANGVALAADGSFVAVAETGGCRVSRLWLTGERAGSVEVLAGELPGYPDNISTGSDGLIWVALPSPRVAALAAIQRLPRPVRGLAARLPSSLQPSPKPLAGVLGVDAEGHVAHHYEGELPGFRMLTGVREQAGTLYFGSLEESSLVVAEHRPS